MNIRPTGYQAFQGTLVLKTAESNNRVVKNYELDTDNITRIDRGAYFSVIKTKGDKDFYVYNRSDIEDSHMKHAAILSAYTAACQNPDVKIEV